MREESPETTFHVAFFPSPAQMANNPYWSMLASGLNDVGVIVNDEPASLDVGWLIRNRKKIDIIHIHYVQSLYCNCGKTRARLVYVILLVVKLLLARLLSYRIVMTLHNLKATNPLRPYWVDFLGHWVVVNFSHCVIVHCKEARRLLALKYGRKHGVSEIAHPNYIREYPNTISKNDARKQLKISEDQFVFLFFGGIRPNKGIETLIEAFISLEGSHFRLLISGNPGNEKAYVQRLQDLAGGDERISFNLYYIPDYDVQNFLNASDVVVLPFSRTLTSGSTILALSFAKPVIAPDIGCLPELLEPDAGWIYKTEDSDHLLKTMGKATMCDTQRFGRNGYKKISECTISRFAKQTCFCYGIKN